jgi:hypothetical protein
LGAILAAVVEAHPPPRLHRCRLYRSVGVLEPEPQRVVVRVMEVGVGLALEGGDLVRYVGQLAGYVLGGIRVVPEPGVWGLARSLFKDASGAAHSLSPSKVIFPGPVPPDRTGAMLNFRELAFRNCLEKRAG